MSQPPDDFTPAPYFSAFVDEPSDAIYFPERLEDHPTYQQANTDLFFHAWEQLYRQGHRHATLRIEGGVEKMRDPNYAESVRQHLAAIADEGIQVGIAPDDTGAVTLSIPYDAYARHVEPKIFGHYFAELLSDDVIPLPGTTRRVDTTSLAKGSFITRQYAKLVLESPLEAWVKGGEAASPHFTLTLAGKARLSDAEHHLCAFVEQLMPEIDPTGAQGFTITRHGDALQLHLPEITYYRFQNLALRHHYASSEPTGPAGGR